MVLARQRGALLRPRLVLLVIIALHTAAADVIFRVPEVLVRHAAASKPVGTGRTNTSRAVESDRLTSDDNLLEVNYEEYFIEHEISTADAKRAAARLQLDQVPSTRAGCGTCSRRELEYCETRVLADHCCCERHFLPEPFPWLPHTCYLGPNRCKPLAHDCARYARLRDCCCYRRLAERWKGILSASAPLHSTPSLPLCLMLLALPFLTM